MSIYYLYHSSAFSRAMTHYSIDAANKSGNGCEKLLIPTRAGGDWTCTFCSNYFNNALQAYQSIPLLDKLFNPTCIKCNKLKYTCKFKANFFLNIK